MRSVASILVFSATTTIVAVLAALLCDGLSPAIAWTSFLLGLAVALLARKKIPAETHLPPFTQWDGMLLLIFALASLRSFLWLLYPSGDWWLVQSANNLGDICKHLQIIRYLASGVEFWPESPFFAGVPLNYYVGVDLLNSLLTLVGVPVKNGLIWVALAGAALSGWALWRWGGAFAIAAFLFNGGLAGFAVFQTGHVLDFQAALAWKNFFLAMFVTQRGLLFALPASLFLYHVWRMQFFGGNGSARHEESSPPEERNGRVPVWIPFLIYSAMPLFSAHAFLASSLVLLGIFVFQKDSRKFLMIFVGCAVLPATVFSYLVTGGFTIPSGVRFLPGWMQEDGGWGFWVWNFGVSLPLLALLAWKTVRVRDAEMRSFAGTGLAIFLACCFVAFAPWPWDNTKLFLWAWLLCAPYLWKCLILPLPVGLRYALCGILFFSGAISLVGGLRNKDGYQLVERSRLDAASKALEKVPSHDLIATEPQYNNPVVLLGRPVVCGYDGMLWAHGLDYRDQMIKLNSILSRSPGWQAAASELGVAWLYTKSEGLIPVPLAHPSPLPVPENPDLP